MKSDTCPAADESAAAIYSSDPFFHYFRILRSYCDLIRLSRRGRDGWSARIPVEFLTRAHPVERRRWRARKGKRFSCFTTVIYLFETRRRWLRARPSYLLIRARRFVRFAPDHGNALCESQLRADSFPVRDFTELEVELRARGVVGHLNHHLRCIISRSRNIRY